MAERFGDYHLLKLIARGGMAEVYMATRSGVDRRIAIKRILPHMSDHREFRTMFLDEARLVAGLDHPNIVQVFDMGQVGNRLFIAMEYINGQSLKQLMQNDGALPIPVAAYITAKVSLGLDYAHNRIDDHGNSLNIIHRDISPQNIMLTNDGRVKIVDFGIAKAATNLYRTKAASLKGKLKYMSPEQVRASLGLDHRTDIYSTGVVLFEMLAGRPPYEYDSELDLMTSIVNTDAPDPRELRDDIPEELVGILAKALARDKAQRYVNSRDLQSELSRFMSRQDWLFQAEQLAHYLDSGQINLPQMPQPTQRNGTPLGHGEDERGGRDHVVNLKAIFGIAAGVLLLLGGLAFFLLSQEDPAPPPTPDKALQADEAWAQKVAREQQEKQREEKQRAFDEQWKEGQRCAKIPELWLSSLQHLATAAKLAQELGLDKEIRKQVEDLRAETQRRSDERQAKLAEQREEEQRRAALQKAQQEREAARRQAEEEARAKRERSRARMVYFPPMKPKETITAAAKAKSKTVRKRAQKFHETNRVHKAVHHYQKALELNPWDLEIYRLMGMAYSFAGERSKAVTCFQRYIKLCPKCAKASGARRLIREYQSMDR